MDIETLAASPCGRLEPISGVDLRGEDWKHYAFVPEPLPAEPNLSLAAMDAATQAAMAVARLDQAGSQLPNPALLVRPAVRREAVSTSALEGTYTAYDDVFEADFMEERQLTSEQREVRNYVHATEQAFNLLTELPISRRLLGQVQKTIVNGTRDDSPEAGDLRTTQVCVGARGAREREVEQARFVPPPPGQILEEGMSAWEKWVNSDNHVPIIAKMALAHYQFETLHPYNNGNGRLGRLVAILQLIEEKVLRWPLINVSPYLDEHRDEYIEELYNISLSGDFNPWVSFFSAAILDQADEGVRTIQELLKFKDVTLAALRRASVRNAAALELVESLIGYPMIDVPTASKMLQKPFQTANRAVAKLVEFGILREITGRNMGRLFACSEVLRITSGRTHARVR